MARVEITETVQRPSGHTPVLVEGAEVQVNIRDGAAATIYAAATGGTTRAQPLVTRNGRVEPQELAGGEAWLDPGSYDLVVTYQGQTWTQRVEAYSGVAEGTLATVEANVGTIQARQVWLNDYANLAVGGVWDAALDAAFAALPGARGTVHVATLPGGASYIFDAAHTLAHGQFLQGPATRSGVPAVNFTCRLNGVQWIVSAGNGSGFENITFTGDVTKAGQDPLVDLGHATNPISSGVFKGCLVQNSGGHGIRVRNCIAWDFSFTYPVASVLSGWKIHGFSNTNIWSKAGATNNRRYGVDYYGGTGNDFGAFQFENNSLENVAQAVTAVAATDVFTKVAHGYSAGDKVAFTGLTGGAGIVVGQPYEVIASGLTADAFKVADIATGTTLDVTSDLTAGTVTRVYGGIRFRGGTEQDYTIDAVFTAPRFENNDGPSGGGVPFQIDAEGAGRQSVKFVGDLYSLERSPTINGGIFHSLGCVTDQTVLGNISSACRAAVWELPSSNTGAPTFTINDPGKKGVIKNLTHWVVGGEAQTAIGLRVSGEAFNRLIIIPKAGGGPQIQGGSGAAAIGDVNLDRDGVNLWGTDHALRFRASDGKGFIQFTRQSSNPAAPGASDMRLFIMAQGSTPVNALAARSGGAIMPFLLEGGALLVTRTTVPADADLAAGQCALWFDATNGASKLMVKAKQADGTVKAAQVALA